MGFLDDYKQMRDERQRKETEELIEHFGGPSGCLKTIFFPITIPFYLIFGFVQMIVMPILAFVLNFAWKSIVIFIILIISIMVLLPIKVIFFLISFGNWNGFVNRFIKKISNVYDADGFYFLTEK